MLLSVSLSYHHRREVSEWQAEYSRSVEAYKSTFRRKPRVYSVGAGSYHSVISTCIVTSNGPLRSLVWASFTTHINST